MYKARIYKITSTRSINFLRKKNLRQYLSFEDNETKGLRSKEDFVKNIEAKEKLDRLHNVLNKIPLKQREVFILRNFDELSYEEISEITGGSVGGLKANYFHAVKKIMELMKDEKN